MREQDGKRVGRREFLAYSGAAIGSALTGLHSPPAFAARPLGDSFVQQIDHVKLYMTHYVLFEEPDLGVPDAIYLDAATGQPTNEFILTAPLGARSFSRGQPKINLVASSEASKPLPHLVEPAGFPPMPPPAPVVAVIQQVTGLPSALVEANTEILLVAIGQFLSEGTTTGRLTGPNLSVDKVMRFDSRIRTAFLFQPPAGVPVPAVGVLIGYLDFGLLHQLIQLPPPPNPTEIVVYGWRAPMTLATHQSFIRSTASEPPPLVEPFPSGLGEVRLVGSRIDADGRYTIVGSAQQPEFVAPPELVQFFFGSTSLSDVEFAVEESGVIA